MKDTTYFRVPASFSCHDDEFVYSICNRLRRRTGEPTSNSFSRRLFGREGASYFALRRVPEGLTNIASSIGVDAWELVEHHTLIPYYESASQVPLFRAQYRELLRGDRANSRYSVSSWRIQPLQFCIHCVREDIRRLGEPIWRRSHQLPGVRVCLRHRCWLTQSCDLCGWRVPHRLLEYPPEVCPRGHRFRPQRPADASSVVLEEAFAAWSCELLDYRCGTRTWPLSKALRVMAAIAAGHARWGLHLNAWLQTRRPRTLDNWWTFLARVSTAVQDNLLDPVLRYNRLERPHPASILLCVKAMSGPSKNVLDAFRDVEPGTLGRTGLTRADWMMIPTRSTEVRVQFLVRLAEERAVAIPGRGVQEFERNFGVEVGLGYGSIQRYKAVAPALVHTLEALRPDLYAGNPRRGRLKKRV
jgi:hypothetical protein